jgi:hypothetical protein
VQRLARDTTDVPGFYEDVIWAWEVTVAMEAAHAEVVHSAATYAHEAVVARERAKASLKESEARTTLIEREA